MPLRYNPSLRPATILPMTPQTPKFDSGQRKPRTRLHSQTNSCIMQDHSDCRGDLGSLVRVCRIPTLLPRAPTHVVLPAVPVQCQSQFYPNTTMPTSNTLLSASGTRAPGYRYPSSAEMSRRCGHRCVGSRGAGYTHLTIVRLCSPRLDPVPSLWQIPRRVILL